MSLEGIGARFAAHHAELPGGGLTPALRRQAFDRFTRLGLPGRSLETWKYTDLKSVLAMTLDYLGPEPDAATIAAAAAATAALGLDAGTPRLAFIDGMLESSLSTGLPAAGIRIVTLAEQAEALLAEPEADDSALAALNRAFVRDGATIRFAAGSESSLDLVFIGSERRLASQLRLRLDLERGARGVITEYFIDLGAGEEAWLNSVTDITLAEDSCLERYRLQQHGAGRIATTLSRIGLAAGASYDSGTVETGGRLVRHEQLVRLDGRGARASLSGLALTAASQHCDTRIAVDHRAADTISRQDYRAIADGRSRSVFNGKVTVREGAQHIDARQRNDNLLLSATAEIDTKPELEIYADQVACSHGATIGELGEEALFYLQSRGIDAATARGILTTAFANVIVGRFPSEDFRARAGAALAGRLPGAAANGAAATGADRP